MSSSQIADMVESVTGKLQDFLEQPQQPVLDFVKFLPQKYVKPNSNKPSVAGLHKGQVWISDDSMSRFHRNTGAVKSDSAVGHLRFEPVDSDPRKALGKNTQPFG